MTYFNVGFLFEKNENNNSKLTTFLGNPPNSIVMNCIKIIIKPLKIINNININDFYEWLSGLNKMINENLNQR